MLNTDFSHLPEDKRRLVMGVAMSLLPHISAKCEEIASNEHGRWTTWKKGEASLQHSFQSALFESGCELQLPLPITHTGEEKIMRAKLLLSTHNAPELLAQLRPKKLKSARKEDINFNKKNERSLRLDASILSALYPDMGIRLETYWHSNGKSIRLLGPLHIGDLYTFMAQTKTLHEITENAHSIALSLSLDLQRLHALGYCHMDLKPENICKTQQGKWVIIDCSLCLRIGVTSSARNGTVGYVAPEILFSMTGSVTPRPSGDVWGLAMIFLALVDIEAFLFLWQKQNECVQTIITSYTYFEEISKIRQQLSNSTCPLKKLCANMLSLIPSNRPTLDDVIDTLRTATPSEESSWQHPS